MSLKLGSTTINALKLGSTAINQAYLGTTEIFSTGTPNGLLNNLISYYKADTNGSFPDAHGSNDGTINGATFTSSGKINGAYSFDGSNDYIDIDTGLISYTNISFGIWFKTTKTSNGALFLYREDTTTSTADQIWLRIEPSYNRIRYTVRKNGTENDVVTTNDYNDGNWHYIVASLNGTNGEITINIDGGSEIASNSTSFTGVDLRYLRIGKMFTNTNSGYDFFLGTQDGFGLWNTVLSDTKKTALYNSGAGLSYDNFTT